VIDGWPEVAAKVSSKQ